MILNFKKGIHHLYIGIAFIIYGYVASNILAYLFGVWLFLDDLYQHRRQVREPKYHSPIHRLYSPFYNISWIRWLNVKADKLFGA